MPLAGEPAAGRPIRIGLMGAYVSRNLGDMAIQLAVTGALRARRPDIEFIGLCQDPQDAVRSFGFPAMLASGDSEMLRPMPGEAVAPAPLPNPDRGGLGRLLARIPALARIRREMRALDMLLISGSGQIDDFWGGPWAGPYNMMVWSSLARGQGKPVAVFGVGVDELHTWLGERFCLRALNAAQLCVVRDPGSRDALESLGYRLPVDVCADPAFHLSSAGKPPANPPFAVISPISRRAWPGAEDEGYDRYLTALAEVADQLQADGVEVRFVCSQTRMDPPIVARVRERMKGGRDRAGLVEVETVDEYLAAVAGARVVVGSRLHAMILAMVAGAPAVAVSAVRKVHQQFADMGMAELAFEMRELDAAPLVRRVREVVGEPERSRQRVVATTRELRAQLDARFDRLASLIPARAAMA